MNFEVGKIDFEEGDISLESNIKEIGIENIGDEEFNNFLLHYLNRSDNGRENFISSLIKKFNGMVEFGVTDCDKISEKQLTSFLKGEKLEEKDIISIEKFLIYSFKDLKIDINLISKEYKEGKITFDDLSTNEKMFFNEIIKNKGIKGEVKINDFNSSYSSFNGIKKEKLSEHKIIDDIKYYVLSLLDKIENKKEDLISNNEENSGNDDIKLIDNSEEIKKEETKKENINFEECLELLSLIKNFDFKKIKIIDDLKDEIDYLEEFYNELNDSEKEYLKKELLEDGSTIRETIESNYKKFILNKINLPEKNKILDLESLNNYIFENNIHNISDLNNISKKDINYIMYGFRDFDDSLKKDFIKKAFGNSLDKGKINFKAVQSILNITIKDRNFLIKFNNSLKNLNLKKDQIEILIKLYIKNINK